MSRRIYDKVINHYIAKNVLDTILDVMKKGFEEK